MEIFAVITTIISVVLLKYKWIYGWVVGIIAAIAYSIVFVDAELFGQAALQLVFIIQGMYGWYNWDGDNTTVIHKIQNAPILRMIGSFTLLAFVLGGIRYSEGSDISEVVVQHLDYYIVGLSLVANYLLTKSILQSWYIWIFVDVLLIGLCTYVGMWWTAGLYGLLLINAVHAVIKWNKEYVQGR